MNFPPSMEYNSAYSHNYTRDDVYKTIQCNWINNNWTTGILPKGELFLGDSDVFVSKLVWNEFINPDPPDEDPFNNGKVQTLIQSGKRNLLPKCLSVNDLFFGALVPELPWGIEIDYFALEKDGMIRCIVGIEKSETGKSNVGIFQFEIKNNKIELKDYFFVHHEKWSSYLRSL